MFRKRRRRLGMERLEVRLTMDGAVLASMEMPLAAPADGESLLTTVEFALPTVGAATVSAAATLDTEQLGEPAGASGTGKTLAAVVVAGRLDADPSHNGDPSDNGSGSVRDSDAVVPAAATDLEVALLDMPIVRHTGNLTLKRGLIDTAAVDAVLVADTSQPFASASPFDGRILVERELTRDSSV
jgi:hypothetical protein